MSRQPPPNIASSAFFDDDEQAWAVGETSGAKKIGHWDYFRDNGTKQGEEDWGDGITRSTYVRFHEDGSVSQSNTKDLRKDVWIGVMRWTRLDVPSVEDRFWPADLPDCARAFEWELDDDGRVVCERIYDREGNRITMAGNPWPERPDAVGTRAFLADRDSKWIEQCRSTDGAKHYRTRSIWDRNGMLLERCTHSDDAEMVHKQEFENGLLRRETEVRGNEKTVNYFRTLHGKTSVTSSTVYRGNNDRTETQYDSDGKPLYSIRLEEVTSTHKRRYDDNHLVFEAIWSKDIQQLPQKVQYFDYQGRIIVDYLSNGDGSGSFRLHDGEGAVLETITISDEAKFNKYGMWDRYLPGFASYHGNRTQTDPEFVAERFRDKVEETRFAAFIATAIRPPELVPILSKFAWDKRGLPHQETPLDKAIVLLLGDDESIAQRVSGWVWACIEEQGCIFSATYDVALTLARAAPVLSQAARRRALRTLADIVALPAMPHEDEGRFAEVLAEISNISELLHTFAQEANAEDRQAVLHMLSMTKSTSPS